MMRNVQKMDKDAKAEVDAAVEEAKQSPFPAEDDLWTDIYVKGTEPPFMRGRERDEVNLESDLDYMGCDANIGL